MEILDKSKICFCTIFEANNRQKRNFSDCLWTILKCTSLPSTSQIYNLLPSTINPNVIIWSAGKQKHFILLSHCLFKLIISKVNIIFLTFWKPISLRTFHILKYMKLITFNRLLLVYPDLILSHCLCTWWVWN